MFLQYTCSPSTRYTILLDLRWGSKLIESSSFNPFKHPHDPRFHVYCYWITSAGYYVITFLSFLFLRLTYFYLFIVAVEGYCCNLSHSVTHGRTPLDEGSARCKDLYLKTYNIHNRQSFTYAAGFETTIPASETSQTYTLDRAATGTGHYGPLFL